MTISQLLCSIQATLLDSRPTLVTNSFLNNSQLKPRIQMLINPQTGRRALWRYALIIPVAALLLMCSQRDTLENEPPARIIGEVFAVVEQNPEPRGGMDGLMNYMQENITYPEAAQKANVSGKVFVSFVVATDGHIADVQVLRGIGFGCDQEAVRVVKGMPNWTPGRQSGKPVNVRFNLPIAFTLEEEANTSKKIVDDFITNYNKFVVDGKVVDQATFTNAFVKGFKGIDSDQTNHSISMNTR